MLRRALRRCFSGPSEIGWVLSASSPGAIHLHPGAHERASAPPPALVARSASEQAVAVTSGGAAPLAIAMPQRMETEVEGGAGVFIHGKLEGSCSVAAAGDIWAGGAVRGAYVDLRSAGGRIDLERVLEGVSSVQAALGVRCARAMGERMALSTAAGELHVGAAYGELALESSDRSGAGSVHLGGVHGSAAIHSGGAPVTALGVTGRLRVSGAPAACAAQLDSARGESAIVGVRGDVTVRVCPPVRLRLQVRAGGGLRVEAGPGGSFEGGLLLAPGAPHGAGSGGGGGGSGGEGGAGLGGGGSGKIRDGGAPITGWWSPEEGGAGEVGSSGSGGEASLTIECGGTATVTVETYAQKLEAQRLQ
jgi:hypothetical protein